MRIVITGAQGMLGRRLREHLATTDWCDELIGIDVRASEPSGPNGLCRDVVADLTDAGDPRWRSAVSECDAIVHFATTNPMPDCSWVEAAGSLLMTANLVQAAGQLSVRRFVFASSNHVMGAYKDLLPAPGPGELTAALPPRPGTMTRASTSERPVAYGASKSFGERLVAATAAASTQLTAVCLRIGWCQPGENHPSTLNAGGMPHASVAPTDDSMRDLAWFRGMWLSTPDFLHLMERAVRADAGGWPSRSVVINGVSANRGSAWSLTEGRQLLGYHPQDDWTAILDNSRDSALAPQ